jgi:hypothetical protein
MITWASGTPVSLSAAASGFVADPLPPHEASAKMKMPTIGQNSRKKCGFWDMIEPPVPFLQIVRELSTLGLYLYKMASSGVDFSL